MELSDEDFKRRKDLILFCVFTSLFTLTFICASYFSFFGKGDVMQWSRTIFYALAASVLGYLIGKKSKD